MMFWFRPLSRRLLPALQLTRMALVFTAVADSLCSLLLWAAARARANPGPGRGVLEVLDWRQAVVVALVSVGLYGFGMSLNDIVDRRRDRQIAGHRPLPSGRIGLVAAHGICALLAALAIAAGIVYAVLWPATGGWASLAIVLWTGSLIAFYDTAGKYLVAPGLLTLGLIRFFHAAFAAPHLPLPWHPLLLLNHVTILSTVAYAWEEKRPPLTRAHYAAVGAGLGILNGLGLWLAWLQHRPAWRHATLPWHGGGWAAAYPAAGVPLFLLVGWMIWRSRRGRRAAGQQLMLYGLLWLIVYDAAFAAGYVSPWAGGALLLLLPVAWGSVQLMRWWGHVLSLGQRPAFRRAES